MKDQKYVNRLKEDIAALRSENKELREKLKSAVDHLRDCDAACHALTSETDAGRKIIWAAAHSMGGKIEIPDDIMRIAANDLNQIVSAYDPENYITIIEAKTEQVRDKGK